MGSVGPFHPATVGDVEAGSLQRPRFLPRPENTGFPAKRHTESRQRTTAVKEGSAAPWCIRARSSAHGRQEDCRGARVINARCSEQTNRARKLRVSSQCKHSGRGKQEVCRGSGCRHRPCTTLAHTYENPRLRSFAFHPSASTQDVASRKVAGRAGVISASTERKSAGKLMGLLVGLSRSCCPPSACAQDKASRNIAGGADVISAR